MSDYEVTADIGTLDFTALDADTPEDAMREAVEQWAIAAADIFGAATFTVREVEA